MPGAVETTPTTAEVLAALHADLGLRDPADLYTLPGRARDLAIHTLLCTNGWLLTPAYIRELETAGLETLIVSLDGPTAAAHDAHRGLPGLTGHIRELLPEMRRAGLNPRLSYTFGYGCPLSSARISCQLRGAAWMNAVMAATRSSSVITSTSPGSGSGGATVQAANDSGS